ncbi:hypothetical protein JCM10207_002169 [Rhodosporidiobolus poonsookiae]
MGATTNDLANLLRAFSQPHPSTQHSQPPMPGALPAQPSPATAPRSPATADSASLLSLLHGMAPPKPAQSVDKDVKSPPTSPALSRGGDAAELLRGMMGGLPVSPPASYSALGAAPEQAQNGPPPTHAAVPTAPPPVQQQQQQKRKPPPNFNFISPFDLLEKTHAQEKATASASASASASSSPVSAAAAARPALSSLPSHLRLGSDGPKSTASTTTSTSDGDDLPRGLASPPASTFAAAPSSPLSATFSAPAVSHIGAFPTTYLASQYLPSPPASASAPRWAPLGLRLPRPSAPHPHPHPHPQTLHITLPDAHAEALAPALPDTTPITLLDLRGEYGGARRTARVWEGGIGYVTKGAKVRVIERESGARVMLKPAGGGDSGKKAKERDEIVDLAVAPAVDEQGRRTLVGVSREGRVTIWSVAESFTEDEADRSFHRLVDLPFPGAGLSANPTLARFHPLYPQERKQTVALVDQKAGKVVVLDLAKAVQQRQTAGAATVVELGSPIADLAYSPDGTAFVALLNSSPPRYTLRTTDHPADEVLGGNLPLPSSVAEPVEASEIAFVYPRGSTLPAGLAVSFARGTHIVIVRLLGKGAECAAPEVTSIDFPLPAAPASPNEDLAPLHYAHLAYHPATQALLVSSSLRGSLFAFRLAFPSSTTTSTTSSLPSPDRPLTTATHLALLCTHGRVPPASESIRIDHVLETPLSSGPVLSFSLDPLVPAEAVPVPPAVQAAGKTALGALVCHPKGVDLVAFAAEGVREYRFGGSSAPLEQEGGQGYATDATDHDADADEFERAMAAGRRMSLEGSIYVSSEVEVCVEGPEPDADGVGDEGWEEADEGEGDGKTPRVREFGGLGPVNGSSEHADGPGTETPTRAEARDVDAVRGDGIAAPGENGTEAEKEEEEEHLEDTQPSVDEPALGDLGAAGLPVTPNVAPSSSALFPSQAAAATTLSSLSPLSSAQLPLPTTPPRPRGARAGEAGGSPSAGGEGEIVRELRRIEQGMKVEIGKIVRSELEKHLHHLEDDRLQSAAATTAREETLLKLALQAVKKDTAKVVEGVVKEQIKAQVGPAVASGLGTAVKGEIGRGVEAAVKKVLPSELDKQLSRPDVAFPLAASIATTIAPGLERTLTTAIVSAVAPAFEHKLSSSIDGVMRFLREEMLDVRKEIVQEQSGVVGILEDEVSALKSEVGSLRAQMDRMEQLLAASLAASAAAHEVASPRMGQTQRAHAREPSHPASVTSLLASPQHAASSSYHSDAATASSGHALPPIPRAPTPPERYEELFTEAMQPAHEPAFAQLVQLINSSPASRLEAVFPHPPQTPKISMAVVLSLAFRLSQVIAQREGPADEEGRRMLAWLRRAVTACDGKQPSEFRAMIPRILSQVLDHLVTRGRRLMALGDAVGAGEIRTVEQYCRARLSLFVAGGGEGAESFRR